MDAFCFPRWHPCLPEEVEGFICEYSKPWNPCPSPAFAAHWFLLCMKVCPSPAIQVEKTVFTRKPTVALSHCTHTFAAVLLTDWLCCCFSGRGGYPRQRHAVPQVFPLADVLVVLFHLFLTEILRRKHRMLTHPMRKWGKMRKMRLHEVKWFSEGPRLEEAESWFHPASRSRSRVRQENQPRCKTLEGSHPQMLPPRWVLCFTLFLVARTHKAVWLQNPYAYTHTHIVSTTSFSTVTSAP